MSKLIQASILFATLAIPMMMARERSAKLGLRKTVKYMIWFNVAYVILSVYVIPRLS